jgi:hypothetical protein
VHHPKLQERREQLKTCIRVRYAAARHHERTWGAFGTEQGLAGASTFSLLSLLYIFFI